MKHTITNSCSHNSCYFRTSVLGGYRKALIKITDRCNLKCAHCFVSSTDSGDEISVFDIRNKIIPELLDAKVISVTLTGGEPLIHTEIKNVIRAFHDAKFSISICSNGTTLDKSMVDFLLSIKGVSVNISLDGFSEKSHGKFRGDLKSFNKTINAINILSKAGLLKGLLCTPNILANIDEYEEIIKFGISKNAKYVLMNPLGNFGRGEKSINKLRLPDSLMTKLYNKIVCYSNKIEIVDIRFPNTKKNLLSSCEAGNIFYIFTNGNVAICPYLVFASKTMVSKYRKNEFILLNILKDSGLGKILNKFNLKEEYLLGNNSQCNSCKYTFDCGKGCPAAIVANGQYINKIDIELCPIKL